MLPVHSLSIPTLSILNDLSHNALNNYAYFLVCFKKLMHLHVVCSVQ